MQDLFSNSNAITVSELTKQIKLTLEENFSELSVIGEISNFKAHVSGHWYFNLKDANAVISCTMWKGLNNYVFFTPQDGMKVIAFVFENKSCIYFLGFSFLKIKQY